MRRDLDFEPRAVPDRLVRPRHGTARTADQMQIRRRGESCLDEPMQMVERPWGVAAYGAASGGEVPGE